MILKSRNRFEDRFASSETSYNNGIIIYGRVFLTYFLNCSWFVLQWSWKKRDFSSNVGFVDERDERDERDRNHTCSKRLEGGQPSGQPKPERRDDRVSAINGLWEAQRTTHTYTSSRNVLPIDFRPFRKYKRPIIDVHATHEYINIYS